MADLSQIKLPNNVVYDLKDAKARYPNDLIVGAQTQATNRWIGVAPFFNLSDGQSITYWLPYPSTGDVTLRLVLASGSMTEEFPCYYSGATRLSNQYPAGNIIRLTYRVNVSISGSGSYTGWWADANYNASLTWDTTGESDDMLMMRDSSGDWVPIASSTSTLTDPNKIASTAAFELNSPLILVSSAYDALTSGDIVYWSNSGIADARYSFNVTKAVGQLTPHAPLYLVGSISSSDGLFHLDSTWWTQTPNDQTKIYILVGEDYDSDGTNIRFLLYNENTWYTYDGTNLNPFSLTSLSCNYGVCSTSASTQLKVVSIPGVTVLHSGLKITVKFTNAQTYNGTPQLNVNGLGAIQINRNGTTAGLRYQWLAGEIIDLVYDGTSWTEVNGGIASTTYYGATKLSSSLTSTSTALAATPSAVKSVNDKIETRVPTPPTTQGNYTLSCTVASDGTATYQWITS